MTADEALLEAQKWLVYLEAQKARATKMQELAHLAKTDQKEAQRQMRQMDQQPTVYDGARLADGVRVMVAEIERRRTEAGVLLGGLQAVKTHQRIVAGAMAEQSTVYLIADEAIRKAALAGRAP